MRLTLTRFCGVSERGNSLDVLLIHDRCAGYVRRVTHDEIADTIG